MNLTWLLLLVMAGRHYGVFAVEKAARGDVWNILSALAVMALALRLWWLEGRTREQSAALVVLGTHEIPVIAGSVAYMVQPWEVPEGMGQLSAWARLELAYIGALLVMLVLAYIVGRQPSPANSDR